MSLKDTIQEDMKAAMRAKDSARLSTIRMLLAACKQREVDERITLNDAAVVAIVEKLIKQRKDSVAAFDLAGRTDLSNKEREEIAVLDAYLPTRLSAAAVEAAVRTIVTDLGALGPADMGRCMAAAKQKLAGQADMGAVSALIKALLTP